MARHLATPFGSLVALVALALAAPLAPVPALAAPLDIQLGFASLPSAQGFTYTTSGAHAGVVEATVFSVSGGVLTQNTMGQSNGVTGRRHGDRGEADSGARARPPVAGVGE